MSPAPANRVVAELLESRQLLTAVLETHVNPGNGHTYHLIDTATWQQAQDAAVALGGSLVTVNDADEQNWLWQNFGNSDAIYWIGYNDADRDGVYSWASGDPSTYTNWHEGEPNDLWVPGEYWGTMRGNFAGQWNDQGPESPQGPFQKGLVEVTPGADMTVLPFGTPSTADLGSQVQFNLTIRNQGSSNVTTARRVARFLSSDDVLDINDRSVGVLDLPSGSLPSNYREAFNDSFTVPGDLSPGRYRLILQIDPDNSVAEGEEANNIAVTNWIDVGATRKPVYRNLVGYVRDNDGAALNGVRVWLNGREVFTDYDRGSKLDKDNNGDFVFTKSLVGYNVSFNNAFSHFRALEVNENPITLQTADTTGLSSKTVGVADFLPHDANQRDGGLGPWVAMRLMTMTESSTKAADGAIRLHRDLRNDRNTIRPGAKLPKQLAAGLRNRKTVLAVAQKLAALGFVNSVNNAITPGETLTKGAETTEAVALFRDITLGYGAADPTSTAKVRPAPALIDEPFISTLNAMQTTTPLWANPDASANWQTSAVQYFNRVTLSSMAGLSVAFPSITSWHPIQSSRYNGVPFERNFYFNNRAGAEVGFGWISTAGKADSGLTWTAAFAGVLRKFWEPVAGKTERDVKLIGGKSIAMPDPAQLNVTWKYVDDYDPATTKAVIESMLGDGTTRVTFNDPTILIQLGAISVTGGKVTVLRSDLVPAAGYDTTIRVRVRPI